MTPLLPPVPHDFPCSHPVRHGPRLLGYTWVDGGRGGSSQRSPRCAPAGNGAPSILVPADPHRRHRPWPWATNVRCSTHAAAPIHMWAGVGAAGAAPRAEPESLPGGAERGRVLEPVEKVVTQSVLWGCGRLELALMWVTHCVRYESTGAVHPPSRRESPKRVGSRRRCSKWSAAPGHTRCTYAARHSGDGSDPSSVQYSRPSTIFPPRTVQNDTTRWTPIAS